MPWSLGVAAVSMFRAENCSGGRPCTKLAGRRGLQAGVSCSLGRPGSLPDGGSLGEGFPGPRFLSGGLPGQAWGLQSWYSAASPTHGRPPLRGSGFVHVLLRTRKPSSQSREQEVHGPQAAQAPLTVCGEVPPLRRSSSTKAGGIQGGWPQPQRAPTAAQRPPAFFQTAHPLPAPSSPSSHSRPRPIALGLGGRAAGGETQSCTVRVAGSRAVRGAGSGLRPPPAKLQPVGVGQRRAAREAEALLLPRPALGHVHR